MEASPEVEVLQCFHAGWQARERGELVLSEVQGGQLPEHPKALQLGQLV